MKEQVPVISMHPPPYTNADDLLRCSATEMNNNNSEVFLGAIIHRPDAPKWEYPEWAREIRGG